MLGSYYVSAIGTAHLEHEGGVCQDHSGVCYLDNGYIAAAIADGLGSAKHSEVGAKLAVDTVFEHLKNNFSSPSSDEYHLQALKGAFIAAYNETIKAADSNGIPPTEYNSTLTVALYNGSDLYFGHCGDGGIIALTYQGDYERITEAEKGENFNETHPLLNGEKYWSFNKCSEQVCAFTMMTDGIFDLVCSPLLKNNKPPIVIPFIRKFMDRNILKANNSEDFVVLQKKISDYISSEKFSHDQNISDDKTLVGVINTEIMPALKDESYYKMPDWEALHENMLNIIYRRTPAANDDTDVPPVGKNDTDISTLQSSIEKQNQHIQALTRTIAQKNRTISKLRRNMLISGIIMAFLFIVTVILLCVLILRPPSDDNSRTDLKTIPFNITTKEENGSSQKQQKKVDGKNGSKAEQITEPDNNKNVDGKNGSKAEQITEPDNNKKPEKEEAGKKEKTEQEDKNNRDDENDQADDQDKQTNE